jgi:hypothetical protein
MHGPSQRLRDAAERGEVELLQAAKALFGATATRDSGDTARDDISSKDAEREAAPRPLDKLSG